MRSLNLLLSFICIFALVACGSEEELIPPAFSNVMVNDANVSTIPYTDASVIITGNIDDFSATIVATTSVAAEVPVVVASDGSWSFPFVLQEGANVISFIASDKRGNLNQLILNLFYAPPAPTDAGDPIVE